jgi:hypothetical protein
LSAALRETAGPRVVVLESSLTLVRLPDRKFRRRTGRRLALDARQLRADERPMQPYFFGFGLRRSVAIVAVCRRLVCVLRLGVGRWSVWFFGFGIGYQHTLRLILLHRLEHLVIRASTDVFFLRSRACLPP